MNSVLAESLSKTVNQIADESPSFYDALILGQQVYSSLLYMYLFSNVSQDSKLCGRLTRLIPKETLLSSYLSEVGLSSVWEAKSNGITYKIRKSYAVLGIQYQKDGFDATYSVFQRAIDELVCDFLELPISDYTHFWESYAWNNFHWKATYRTSVEHRYSEKDIDYKASLMFQQKTYTAIGHSKKNAIEQLAHAVVNEVVPHKDRVIYAKSQNYEVIKKNKLEFDSVDYEEQDEATRLFAEKTGVDYLMMRFALLSRSQMGRKVWESLGVEEPDFLKTKVALLKRGIITLGQELLLLQVLDYNIRNHTLRNADLSTFDLMSINIGPEEIHEQLVKMLRINELWDTLFIDIGVPVAFSCTNKERCQIGNGIIAAIFLSSFSPDKVLLQLCQRTFENFYLKEGISFEIDYRYALIAYLSAFGIRTETNHYEIGNGIFHAEIVIHAGKNTVQYCCENESMRYAKKEAWHIAYRALVDSVRAFFSGFYDTELPNTVFLFMDGVCKAKITMPTFFVGYGILSAETAYRVEEFKCAEILRKIRSKVDSSTYENFVSLVCEANDRKYLCRGDEVYSYREWFLQYSHKNHVGITVEDAELPTVYSLIANPSVAVQKKIIDIDYRNVQKIYSLSDDIAKYALSVDRDAYNYFLYISPNIAAYYKKLIDEETAIADVGLLVTDVCPEMEVSILDSHKALHMQIADLIDNLHIEKIAIACGYCFASGLGLLKSTLEGALQKGIPFDLFIGSLQNYSEETTDNLITGIDKATVNILNRYLHYDCFKLFTCPDRFYHGKVYLFEGKDNTVIVLGSSNVSRAAFVSNYELNIAFRVPTKTSLHQNFEKWLGQLRYYSKRISVLNEEMFGSNEIKMDGSALIKHMTVSSMRNKISELTNAEVQYRLNLWMSHTPDIIAEDLGVLSLPNYFVFVFRQHELVVLESFEPGNAYFCIKSKESFENIINTISTFSKTEIFEYSKMGTRGYHVQNKFTLESNIRKYFRR